MQVFIRQLNPTYEDIIGRILRKIEPKTLHSTETEGPGGLSRGTPRVREHAPPLDSALCYFLAETRK